MGMNMSFMGMGPKGVSASQILSLVTDTMYDQFVEKDTKDFDGFLVAILDTFSTINMALPGKHYDPPSHEDVTDLFNRWDKARLDDRKEIFTDFLKKNVHINKVDGSMIVTAIVAPPAAMVVKRTGQTLPQLRLMKAVPDVVFVPSATVVSLIAVKILRLMFMKKKTPKDAQKEPDAPEKKEEPPRVETPKNAQKEPDAPEKKEEPPRVETPKDAQKEPDAPEQKEETPRVDTPTPAAPADKTQGEHAGPNTFCALCKDFH